MHKLKLILSHCFISRKRLFNESLNIVLFTNRLSVKKMVIVYGMENVIRMQLYTKRIVFTMDQRSHWILQDKNCWLSIVHICWWTMAKELILAAIQISLLHQTQISSLHRIFSKDALVVQIIQQSIFVISHALLTKANLSTLQRKAKQMVIIISYFPI